MDAENCLDSLTALSPLTQFPLPIAPELPLCEDVVVLQALGEFQRYYQRASL